MRSKDWLAVLAIASALFLVWQVLTGRLHMVEPEDGAVEVRLL